MSVNHSNHSESLLYNSAFDERVIPLTAQWTMQCRECNSNVHHLFLNHTCETCTFDTLEERMQELDNGEGVFERMQSKNRALCRDYRDYLRAVAYLRLSRQKYKITGNTIHAATTYDKLLSRAERLMHKHVTEEAIKEDMDDFIVYTSDEEDEEDILEEEESSASYSGEEDE